MVRIPGGAFRMGSDEFYSEERPAHWAMVGGFWMDAHPVTNAEFREFVDATGYLTVAERPPDPAAYPGADPALLVPGSLVFRRPPHPVGLHDYRAWWEYVPGANWWHPEGAGSDLEGREQHPVVHIAYEDAAAYAAWAGKELPTEAEWEFAARGGLEGALYAWGDEFSPGGRLMANTWQGEFPWQNLALDGFEGTSPVGSFPANGFGLFDVTGNVWEWTTDPYIPSHHHALAHTDHRAPSPMAHHTPSRAPTAAGRASERRPGATGKRRQDPPTEPCCAPRDRRVRKPAGVVAAGQSGAPFPRRVIKGGSHLCAPSYCLRYRPAARQGETVDTSASHLGFRCVVRGA